MSQTPNNKSYLKWEKYDGGADFLQLSDRTGGVLGWVDGAGALQGSLITSVIQTQAFAGAPTGSCSPQQTAVNSLTGDFYSCQNGAWTLIGPTAGSLVSPITSPNPLVFDVATTFKGPSPYADVTAYGVRSTATNVTPFIPGITATINAGSSSASISSASSFKNGDGVTIWGAGATISLSTPGAPTVTPSNAAAGTMTGLTVVDNGLGTTAYSYQIVARDKAGGLTAAGTVGTTSTGQSSLGAQSVSISGWIRSGSTVTATTSSAHGLSVGTMVYVLSSPVNASDNLHFCGWYIVSAVADNTHFSYSTGQTVVNGAPTASIGGGTVYWWNSNHLTWTPVAGAFCYYIYGRTSGSITLLGVSLPQGAATVFPSPTWDDFGSTMMAGPSVPFFVPSTPPVSALNDPLVTTILSGAGTTTLTLAATATNSVSGQTILFDNAPIINSLMGSRWLYFPPGAYVVNSYVSPGTNTQTSILLGGALFLNDTFEIASLTNIYGDLGPQSKSSASFGWRAGQNIVVNRANPGFYSQSGHGILSGLQFQYNNATVAHITDVSTQCIWQNCNYVGNGYTCIGLVIRDIEPAGGSFFNIIDTCGFIQGPGQINGACATPALYMNGVATMSNLSLQNCGIFNYIAGEGTALDSRIRGVCRMQGGIMPFFTLYATHAGQAGSFAFENIELDTMDHAMFANLSPLVGNVLTLIFQQGTGPGDGFGWVTGIPVGTVQGSVTGQNTGVISNNSFSDTFVSTLGIGRLGYQLATPGAPTLAANSGGNVPTGTHTYALAAYDLLGNFTAIGPTASIVVNSGTQTITVTPPSPFAPGTVGYAVFRDGLFIANSSGTCSNNNSITSPTGTFTDIFASTCNNNPTSLGAAASAVSSSGLTGTQITLSQVPFAILGTPVNGTFVYCPDCTVANPCAGSGTGALAKRLNSTWVCN